MGDGEEERRGSLVFVPTTGVLLFPVDMGRTHDLFPIFSILSTTSCNACKKNSNSF